MGIFLGFVIILVVPYVPSALSMGIYWEVLLVSIPSFAIGCLGKVHYGKFCLGVITGGITVAVINFDNWLMLWPFLASMQIVLILAAIVSFSLGWALLAPIKEVEEGNE